MKVIGFHIQHDANLAVAVDGRLLLVLELERLFEQRYFASAVEESQFAAQWGQAIEQALKFTGLHSFDVAVTSWVMPRFRRALAGLVQARRWVSVDHHTAHAWNALQDSPFERALICSFDGGGNDGTFNLYLGRPGEIRPLQRIPLNLGTPYRLLATTMAEVTGRRPQPRAGHLALAGKLMGYAALGRPRAAWKAGLRDYYTSYHDPTQALFNLGEALGLELDPDALPPEEARCLAATSQAVFEDLLLEQVRPWVDRCGAEIDGLALAGGCALNVVANQRLRQDLPVPVWVPPAPGDDGIALGAVGAVERLVERPAVFAGLPLVMDVPDSVLAGRGARPVQPAELADLLAGGAVIGVARGRAEIGPRALGNRSILAFPDRAGLIAQLNERIKFREWYRPFAPVVPDEQLHRLVDEPGLSPYMSFAPRLRADAAMALPAITHLDGTARIQTVSAAGNAWLHSLLLEVGRRTGWPVLLNTSFNTRGQPLLQRASAALELLDTTGLDYVLIEDRLVGRTGPGGPEAAG